MALTAYVASEARRLFTATNQQLNGKSHTSHCMGFAGSKAYWLASATFRRGATQAGCTIQLSNDSNKGLIGTPGNHNMNPNSQGSCMTEQIILCSRSKGIQYNYPITCSLLCSIGSHLEASKAGQ